jgi:hypothetical protein
MRRGQLIVAKTTSERWGYRKGDVLRVRRHYGEIVAASNLTQPNQYGKDGDAILYLYEIDTHVPKPERTVTTHKFLGIPVWRKTVVHYEREAIE